MALVKRFEFDCTFIHSSERLLGVSSVNVKRGAVRSSKLRWSASVEGGKTIIKIPYIVSGGMWIIVS